MKQLITRNTIAAWSAGVFLVAGAIPAGAADQSPELQQPGELPKLERQNWDHAVSDLDPELAIIRFDLNRFIEELGDKEPEEDDVIVLETDILFAPNSWDLPEMASAKIEELVQDVPEGSAVSVTGHTDSRPVSDTYDFDNQELSENRAQAVAEVLESQRPDFDITAQGLGDAQPAVTEDPEVPGTYAANRRVEIRYGN